MAVAVEAAVVVAEEEEVEEEASEAAGAVETVLGVAVEEEWEAVEVRLEGSFLIEIRILFGRIRYLVNDVGLIPIELI